MHCERTQRIHRQFLGPVVRAQIIADSTVTNLIHAPILILQSQSDTWPRSAIKSANQFANTATIISLNEQ